MACSLETSNACWSSHPITYGFDTQLSIFVRKDDLERAAFPARIVPFGTTSWSSSWAAAGIALPWDGMPFACSAWVWGALYYCGRHDANRRNNLCAVPYLADATKTLYERIEKDKGAWDKAANASCVALVRAKGLIPCYISLHIDAAVKLHHFKLFRFYQGSQSGFPALF